ncbi:MAG: antibiotic biosynthesis monooxygenase family protein [Syntrophobacteria bacterium]
MMTVRVLIERKIIPGKELDLTDELTRLRSKAMRAKGYISGETLRALDDPNHYLVISTWNSFEDWKTWEADTERQEIQGKIDKMLEGPAVHRIFVYD